MNLNLSSAYYAGEPHIEFRSSKFTAYGSYGFVLLAV